ncbi:MAG: PKD domain-containing protein [Planctomycetota bacterium]
MPARKLIMVALLTGLWATCASAGELTTVTVDSYSSRLGQAWDAPLTLDGDTATFWVTSKSDNDPFIIYRLADAPVALGKVTVCNLDFTNFRWQLNTAIVSYRAGDSGDFTQLGAAPIQFDTAKGAATEIDFGGLPVQYVKITPLTNWDGTVARDVSLAPPDGSSSDYMVGFSEITFAAAGGYADAGPDQTVYDADDDGAETVTLDGSASDYPDGTITDYTWSEDGTVIATGADAAVTLPVGEHTIVLTITADDATTDSDTVVMTVEGTPQSFANAGPDQVLIDSDGDGNETATLDGSGSAWSTATWEWREGDTVLGTGATPAVTLPVGVHTIDLYCTDMSGHDDSDTVVIDIRAGAQPPVADAGLDRTVMDVNGDGGETVALDGSASVDYDGTIVSWDWTEDGAPVATGETAQAVFALGDHTVTLTVTDNEARTGTDTVLIRVVEYVPSPTDAPYVGAHEADSLFGRITADDMAIISNKKVLMASRSFGLNLKDGFARCATIDPMYTIDYSTDRYDVNNNDIYIVPDDAFTKDHYVQYLCTLWPLTARVTEFETQIRQRFADDIDAAIIFYHSSTPATFSTYATVMDSLRLDYPDIKFIYVTSGVSPVPGTTSNIDSNLFAEQVLATYRGEVPIYDLLDILSTHEDGSAATFESGGRTYRYMCPEFNINGDNTHPNAAFSEERMGRAMLVMLYKLFVESPGAPGDADGDGDVDLDDFVILKNNFGTASGATQATGDFDGNGNVDLDDFVVLKNNFGT